MAAARISIAVWAGRYCRSIPQTARQEDTRREPVQELDQRRAGQAADGADAKRQPDGVGRDGLVPQDHDDHEVRRHADESEAAVRSAPWCWTA